MDQVHAELEAPPRDLAILCMVLVFKLELGWVVPRRRLYFQVARSNRMDKKKRKRNRSTPQEVCRKGKEKWGGEEESVRED